MNIVCKNDFRYFPATVCKCVWRRVTVVNVIHCVVMVMADLIDMKIIELCEGEHVHHLKYMIFFQTFQVIIRLINLYVEAMMGVAIAFLFHTPKIVFNHLVIQFSNCKYALVDGIELIRFCRSTKKNVQSHWNIDDTLLIGFFFFALFNRNFHFSNDKFSPKKVCIFFGFFVAYLNRTVKQKILLCEFVSQFIYKPFDLFPLAFLVNVLNNVWVMVKKSIAPNSSGNNFETQKKDK